MQVLGRDATREAYRVSVDGGRVVGLLPDAVIRAGLPLTGGAGHQTAHEWIARHHKDIERALHALYTGVRTPRAPFDRIVLEDA